MSAILTSKYLHKSPFQLEGIGLLMPDIPHHPNRSAFTAVLTRIEEPSTRPPGGAAGHRVRISRAAAEAALPSLIGMAVNCSENLSDHAKQTKIGMITEAHIHGNDVVISGHLFEKDFSNEVACIRRNIQRMGASYEISDVEVRNPHDDIWDVDHLIFTGAALLFKDKAAYAQTSLVAQTQELSMAEVTEIMTELQHISAKLDIAASHDQEADEDAARVEAEEAAALTEQAATSRVQAQRAAADQDTEEATRHTDAAKA